ncbi:MAG: aspC [Clostridiales bacterium]|jgi:aspartate aminotransferase|nr:aspC [Clostridiales bacterium]
MLSRKVKENLGSSSWIRAMFEQGNKLKQQFGAENVYDFSLGNPDPEPPKECLDSIKKIADTPKIHGYMPNAGFLKVREQVATQLQKETGLEITANHIVMTCGAGGALNIVLKTIINPGEEIIVLAPFFAEYVFYADNHQAKLVIVETDKETFQPDVSLVKAAINKNTKAIIINTPNNPTGVAYSQEKLEELAKAIEEKEQELNTTIFILSDEPYRKIAYDNIKLPSVISIFKHAIMIDSFSKSLSLPGERIGYVAANPAIECMEDLMAGLVFSNRVLGYVNAPAMAQLVVGECIDAKVDIAIYEERRNELYKIITEAGFECIKPEGAFYLFPKSPIQDDIAFIQAATKYNLVLVPGTGFRRSGHFRLAYCVSMETIRNSKKAFEALAKEFGLR